MHLNMEDLIMKRKDTVQEKRTRFLVLNWFTYFVLAIFKPQGFFFNYYLTHYLITVTSAFKPGNTIRLF